MNYPFWEVPFLGGGMLIGVISILHVFVSHFAIGGGLFLALTERRAQQTNDSELRDYVRRHSQFFLLLTVVFGAVSGVGIWFSIALVHPSATSLLIHTFVWAWAIEWTFFLTEIAAILIYCATWDRLDPRTHNRIAWIYFIAAYMSLVIINGILAFMLTPGKWIETGSFWQGLFNPSYLPSLLLRTFVALALAGVYALFTASFRNETFKERVIPYASRWLLWSVPFLVVGGIWYLAVLPELSRHIVRGGAPVVQLFAGLGVLFTVLVLPFGYFLGVKRPRYFSPMLGVLFLLLALLATGVGEWVREAVRKPYIIYDYMYSNALRVDQMKTYRQNGFLSQARWARIREFDPENREESMQAGKELFRGQCGHCHTVTGFNAVAPLVYRWREEYIFEQLGRLDEVRAFMPPFVGTDAERRALAGWLAELDAPKQ